MVDREKVLAVLKNRFPQASPDVIAAAANAIVGLEDEWEAIEPTEGTLLSMGESDIRIYRKRG